MSMYILYKASDNVSSPKSHVHPSTLPSQFHASQDSVRLGRALLGICVRHGLRILIYHHWFTLLKHFARSQRIEVSCCGNKSHLERDVVVHAPSVAGDVREELAVFHWTNVDYPVEQQLDYDKPPKPRDRSRGLNMNSYSL